MNIADLAAIVTVRNHINIVMNDKTVSSKDDFKPLNEARIKLDKKFIEALRNISIENLLPSTRILCEDNYKPPAACSSLITPTVQEQLSLNLSPSPDGILEEAETPPDHLDDTEQARYEESVELDQQDPEAADLALIAARVKAQKEQLKKEGRSNKRVSKAKEDGTDK